MKQGLFRFPIRLLFFSTVLILALALSVGGRPSSAGAKVFRIGVVQIVQHPALDAARDGFVASLKDQGFIHGQNVRFDFQNAQGDLATAQAIAQKFVADRVDMILAIATPTAQACAIATKNIPILITAVTDPVSAQLVKSLRRPGTNITGTSDLTPVEQQLRLLARIAPKASRVGVVFNPGETNSVVQVKIAEEAARKLHITLVQAPAVSSSGVFEAAQSLIGKVQAIYVPTDNTVVSAIESVVKVANENRLPLVVAEESGVSRGALATVGISYYDLGVQTGVMAVKVLRGAKPAHLPIEYQSKIRKVINLKAAAVVGLTLPADVLKDAEIIQ